MVGPLATVDERKEDLASCIRRTQALETLAERGEARLPVGGEVSRVLRDDGAIRRCVEGTKLAPSVRARSETDDLGDGMHLEVHGSSPVGNDVILVDPVGKMDAIGSARK